MKAMKSMQLRTEPCRRPLSVQKGLELLPPMTTCVVILSNICFRMLMREWSRFLAASFSHSFSRHVVGYASFMSRKKSQ